MRKQKNINLELMDDDDSIGHLYCKQYYTWSDWSYYHFFADNLEEDSNYEVKVEARNEWGWSQTSEVFRFYTRNKGDMMTSDYCNIQQWLNSGEDEDDKNVNSC